MAALTADPSITKEGHGSWTVPSTMYYIPGPALMRRMINSIEKYNT